MLKTAQQFSDFNKTSLETAIGLAKISMTGAERMIKLQLDSAKSAFEENVNNAKALLSIHDAEEFASIRAKQAEHALQKAIHFSQAMNDITTEAQNQIVFAFEKAMKNAPGAEAAIAAIRSTLTATQAAVDSFTKQASQLAEATLKASTAANNEIIKKPSSRERQSRASE